jgi:protein gp37
MPMAIDTAIEWTESTWNPVTGCTKISAGCAHCYAERMARRLHAIGVTNYALGFSVAIHEESLRLPFTWRKPRRILVNSMSDPFHENVPDEFIFRVFDAMNDTPRHQYQILTKRSERLLRMSPKVRWAHNIWMGVTVEDERYLMRADHLRKVPAAIKFLSLEPLLGPLRGLELDGLDWIIVGGESGPGARPLKESWVIDIKEKCRRAGIPFFSSSGAALIRKRRAGF